MNKRVGIVIVNYNGEKFQNDCIESIYDMNFQNFEIIIVDSGSSDNSIPMIRDKYPKVHILEQHENVGVAVGNNIGIKYGIELGLDYTLLLNNDVELDKALLDCLMKEVSEHEVVVPKIYYYNPSDVLWFAGGNMIWKYATGDHMGRGSKDEERFNITKYIDYAPTCCMLIDNRIFSKVGFMDETLFMYFDDTDLCVRFIDAGIKIKYVPSAKMWHKVSSSSGGEKSKYFVYYDTRNHFYFLDKYKSKINRCTRIRVYVKYLVKYLLSPVRCKNDKFIGMAYKDYKQKKMGRNDNL